MRVRCWGWVLGLGLLGGTLAADERADFRAAQAALNQGRQAEYTTLRARLTDYPLAPYLDYWALRKRLPQLSVAELEVFWAQYPETWFAENLRQAWLEQLADAARWQDYLRVALPVGDSTLSQCRYRYALVQVGRADEAWPGIEALWLAAKPQPAPCEPLFDAWAAAGLRTTTQVEQRLLQALAARELGLAKTLTQALPPARREWANQALRAYGAPASTLREADLPPELAVVALVRLAASDAPAALRAWAAAPDLAAAQHASVAGVILQSLLKQEPPNLLAQLAQIPAQHLTAKEQALRLRQALVAEDWARLAEWAGLLPEAGRAEEWRYWQARAWARLGQAESARAGFAALASERTFYGFLAADQVGQPYNFHTTPLQDDPELRGQLAARSPFQRLREALALDLDAEAKREWATIFPGLDEREAQAAIRLLDSWDWVDQAQFALAKRGFWQDLEFRFPLRHRAEVMAAAETQHIDPAWIYGVIRQESVFNAKAVSSANARGLMQLLPETAKTTARREGLALAGTHALFRPEVNIALGSAYLRQLYDRFEGHLVLATAGYNAGPNRPAAWRKANAEDTVRWIELIPFQETRTYVKRVLAYRTFYQWRLGLPMQRLSAVLTEVGS